MQHVTRFTPLYLCLFAALLFVGCDESTITSTEDGSTKSDLAVQFDQIPSDTPAIIEADPAPFSSLGLSKDEDIKDQYIVVFKDNVASRNVPSMVANMAQAQGGQVLHSYEQELLPHQNSTPRQPVGDGF